MLSAKHGLVAPDTVLAWFDRTLKSASVAERCAWRERVLRDLDAAVGPLNRCIVEIHTGIEYRAFAVETGLRARGATVEVPTLGLGLGHQVAFYNRAE